MTNSGDRPKPPPPGLFTRVMRRRYGESNPTLEDLSDELDSSPAAGWVYGVLFAGLAAAYGVACFINGYGYFLGTNQNTDRFGRSDLFALYEGAAANWLACLYVGLGLMLHFHSFWGTRPRLARYREPLFYLAAVVTGLAAAMTQLHHFGWLR